MIRLFDTCGPRVFGAPPGADFAAQLAAGVRARLAGAPPEALAGVEITLNTLRAIRATQAAFEAAGPAVFLPRLTAMDVFASAADAPPAIDRLSRRLILTRLTSAFLSARPEFGASGAAEPLAEALAGLLDEFQREHVPLSALERAAETDPAAHWRRTLEFLMLIREAWPAQLSAAPEQMDPEARRRRQADALLAEWAAAPPERPIIAAGSTGSTRTTADLLVAIAGLPQGALILAGFDFDLDAEGWAGITPDHPQFGHARLLERLGLSPAEVRRWDEAAAPSPRARLLTEALRPAPVTHRWRSALGALGAEAGASTGGLELIEAPSPAREAEAIALLMREALDEGRGRIALVTPDRNLARRVAAALGRWGLVADDSAGRPLGLSPPGVLASMVAAMLCRPFDQVALLALLKHPLAASGPARRAHLAGVARLELAGFRRRAVALRLGSIEDIEAAEILKREESAPLADEALRPALAALRAWSAPAALPDLVAAHRAALEALAGETLFERADGRALRAAFDRFAEAAESYGEAEPGDYPQLFSAALAEAPMVHDEALEPHPRLHIWGPLEARSQLADVMILGGLNEASWPPAPAVDPWLSRPMRERIGLSPPERRIGLSAHDFLQAAAAPRAVLTRSLKTDGAPTTPSRWLSRITALLGAVDRGAPLAAMRMRGARWLALADAMAAPPASMGHAPRPAPRPPARARPRRLSVTEIETLIRDPYAIYARHVLGLRAFDDAGAAADQRDRGEVLHEVVERFIGETMENWPGAGAGAIFDRIAAEVIAASVAAPVQGMAWAARLARVRDWFLAGEEARRALGRPVALEASGVLEMETASGRFLLRGRADRVDALSEGGFAIYDYKAQSIPTQEQIRIFQKQLPLLALIAEAAGLEGAGRGPVSRLAYLSLSGAGEGGKMVEVEPEPDARARLIDLIEAFEGDRAYLARAYPEMISYGSDYDHLSRFGEWGDRAADAPPPGAEP